MCMNITVGPKRVKKRYMPLKIQRTSSASSACWVTSDTIYDNALVAPARACNVVIGNARS